MLESLYDQPVFSGGIIKLIKSEGKYFRNEHSWLSARHRMLFRIPLPLDRMAPLIGGIGPKLMAAIEADRQKNGDFDKFFAPQRVKGNGPKKLKAWQDYFIGENRQEKN